MVTISPEPTDTPQGSTPKLSDQWPCPACGALVGEPCYVPIPDIDTTGWDHDARILAPLFAELRGQRP